MDQPPPPPSYWSPYSSSSTFPRSALSSFITLSALIEVLSKFTASKILAFIIYLLEYWGSSMLKKHVSALGRAWSGFCLFIIGFIWNLIPFLSNSSLFNGNLYCPQQNFIIFNLYYSDIYFIIYQKYLLTGVSSFCPLEYVVCFLSRSTSTLGTPHIIVLSYSPDMWFKNALGIISNMPYLIFLTCKLIYSLLLFSIIWTYYILF